MTLSAVSGTPSPAWYRAPLRFGRPTVSTEVLLLLAASFLLLGGNGSFWRAMLTGHSWQTPATWGFAASLFVAFTAFYVAFAGLFATRRTVKPLLSLLILVTAFASWYIDKYAIYLDRAMLRNVMATHWSEASELLGWPLLLHVLWLGVLPAALVWWPRLTQRRCASAVGWRLAWVGGALVVGVVALLLVFADFSSVMRNRPEVRYLLTPGNAVSSLMRNAWGHAAQLPGQPLKVVGADAHLGPAWGQRDRPVLFVMVVGETARASNFSLNGYARQTNPLLAQRKVLSFSNTIACGTSTEVSLPCMFSQTGRGDYDEDRIRSEESLLHVLNRAGFGVLWRDNQSGCKGVCKDLPVQTMDQLAPRLLCNASGCLDEALLDGLQSISRDARGNLFVVMHQLGSHGPSYYKRYPAAFKRFLPACETDNLHDCSSAEILNAYDNSLLYTDYFLSRVIDFLQGEGKKFDTAMLYVSDHGESLGESGLYLHGMPYQIAPDVQKRVPLVMWLSPGFQRSFRLDDACLRNQQQLPLSHDNLFHSVLGVLEVQTQAYKPALDVFAPCRIRPTPSLAAATAQSAP